MKKAFNEVEKALLVDKKFNLKVLRKMRLFELEDFEYHSLFQFFNDFIVLIPGADTPCAVRNFERMKHFAREQSAVYNLLPGVSINISSTRRLSLTSPQVDQGRERTDDRIWSRCVRSKLVFQLSSFYHRYVLAILVGNA